MKQFRPYFPLSFNVRTGIDLLVSIVIYLVLSAVAGLICRMIGVIPILGVLVAWIIGAVVGVYVLLGIVLAVLVFAGAINRQ